MGEIYDQPKIVRKILKSLTENFRPKVTTIIESKDVDSILVDELLETFSEITIERQEVRTLLNLEILGRMIPLRLTIMTNLEKK